MPRYGKKIQQARKAKGMTLKDLEEKIGVSAGYLSKIERDENTPSYTILQKICYALNITSGDLEGGQLETEAAHKYFYPKQERSLLYEFDFGYKMEMIFSSKDHLDLSYMTLSGKHTVQTSRHYHTEVGMIIKGVMKFVIDGEKYIAYPGDSIFVPAGVEHSFERVGEEPAESLWVQFIE